MRMIFFNYGKISIFYLFVPTHQRTNTPTHQHLENERDAWHVTLGEIEWWQMADGSFLGSRFLTAYRLQFSMDSLFRKEVNLVGCGSQPFQDGCVDVIVSQISNLSFLWSSKMDGDWIFSIYIIYYNIIIIYYIYTNINFLIFLSVHISFPRKLRSEIWDGS